MPYLPSNAGSHIISYRDKKVIMSILRLANLSQQYHEHQILFFELCMNTELQFEDSLQLFQNYARYINNKEQILSNTIIGYDYKLIKHALKSVIFESFDITSITSLITRFNRRYALEDFDIDSETKIVKIVLYHSTIPRIASVCARIMLLLSRIKWNKDSMIESNLVLLEAILRLPSLRLNTLVRNEMKHSEIQEVRNLYFMYYSK